MSNTTITTLVTGATGNIGGRVVKALRQTGAEVLAGVRDPSRADALRELGATPVRFDYRDPESMRAALDGVDRLFLLTPFVEFSAPLAEAAMKAAREAGVSFVLKLSALGADPEGPFAIGRDHGTAEEAVQGERPSWAVLRPSFFMDNPLVFQAGAIQATGAFYGAGGGGRAAWVSPDDIAAVAAAILQAPEGHHGLIWTLTGGEALSDADLASALSDASGRAVAYVDLAPEQLQASLLEQGAPGWQVQALLDLETVKRNNWATEVSPAVEEILGRPPETFAAFLENNPSLVDAIRA